MTRKAPLLALSAALALAAGAALAQSAVRVTQASWLSPAPDPARGEQLAQVCATCHVANSPQVDPPAPRLSRQRQSYVFFALLAYRDGTRQSDIMSPFIAGMSNQDLRDIAAYVSGEMHNVPPRARTDMAAYDFTLRECIWCHGETGIGEFENMPVLAGQDPAYLRLALQEYRDGTRINPTMNAVAQELDPAMDEQIADYYAAHEWLEHGE